MPRLLQRGISLSARSSRCPRLQRSSTHTSKRTHPNQSVTTCAVSRSCAHRCVETAAFFHCLFSNYWGSVRYCVALCLCLCEIHMRPCSLGHRLPVVLYQFSNPLLALTSYKTMLEFSVERILCRTNSDRCAQIAEGLGKPAMEAWRKTQTTARNETNSKLRGQQVPATNTCFYGSSNKESDAIPHGMGTERFFIPDDEEPAVHNPPRFDDDYLDKMGVKKYHWEMTEDAMRHSIVPGHYMRWKNAGMDRFGRAQGANKLS
mmetsp:Transcript_43039/g.116062  ORF Transcript_43039/g.116062 Transcript_43039/m.116062 type:complete len:261 (+) Transcript_43039:1732-2514(+)